MRTCGYCKKELKRKRWPCGRMESDYDLRHKIYCDRECKYSAQKGKTVIQESKITSILNEDQSDRQELLNQWRLA